MAHRLIPSVALLLAGSLPLLAADRAAEAKRYAADLNNKSANVRATALVELGKLGQLQRKLTAPYVSDISLRSTIAIRRSVAKQPRRSVWWTQKTRRRQSRRLPNCSRMRNPRLLAPGRRPAWANSAQRLKTGKVRKWLSMP